MCIRSIRLAVDRAFHINMILASVWWLLRPTGIEEHTGNTGVIPGRPRRCNQISNSNHSITWLGQQSRPLQSGLIARRYCPSMSESQKTYQYALRARVTARAVSRARAARVVRRQIYIHDHSGCILLWSRGSYYDSRCLSPWGKCVVSR